jgi:hypothetical protein
MKIFDKSSKKVARIEEDVTYMKVWNNIIVALWGLVRAKIRIRINTNRLVQNTRMKLINTYNPKRWLLNHNLII